MTNESFSISELIPARPDQVYAAWMNSDDQTAFTGDAATIDPVVGGAHSAFSGYAHGMNVDLTEGRRIVQTWRTNQFPDGSPDSRLEVTLEETVGGTMVTILHTEIPSGQSNTYRHGWEKYYLEALKSYFGRADEPAEPLVEPPPAPVKKMAATIKAVVKKAAATIKAAVKKATPKKKAVTKKKAVIKKKTAVRKKAAPKKKIAPKKKTAVRKKAAPKKKATAKSKPKRKGRR